MALCATRACPAPRAPFQRPSSRCATSNRDRSSAPRLRQKASSEFFLCRRAITSFASKPRTTRCSSFPILPCNQTKSQLLRFLLSPPLLRRRARAFRVSLNLGLHFPPKCYPPSERIANFAIVSTQIRTTSKIFHLARCLRLPTSTTRFQTAGRLSSPITAAIRNTASTSTPSIVGTILSIAIASRVMSPSGPSCSANRFF